MCIRDSIHIRISNVEEDNLIRIESLQETQEDIVRVQARFGERFEDSNANVNEVKGQVNTNKEKIEEIRQRELVNIREELKLIWNRPLNVFNIQTNDNRE